MRTNSRGGSTTQQKVDARSFRAHTLRQLLAFFDREHIPYAVLGDVHRLIEAVDSDVDIVVSQGLLPQIPIRLARFFQACQLYLVQSYKTYHGSTFLVFADAIGAEAVFYLHLDLSGDFYRHGKRFMTSEDLLSGRVLSTNTSIAIPGIYVPRPARAFMYYLIKKVSKRELRDDHGSYLSRQWRQDPVGAAQQVRKFWNGSDVDLIIQAAESDHWEDVRERIAELRGQLHKHVLFSPASCLRLLSIKVRRILYPAGLSVAFIGPDGSGKTALVEHVKRTLAPTFSTTAALYRRPGLYPGRRPKGPPTNNPHVGPQHGLLWSIAKLLTLLFDFTVGYWCKILPMRAGTGLVLFDRYYHDILADPKRYSYNGPRWLARLVERMLPRPDLLFFFDAPPEVIQARKKEVPFDETARQLRAYRRIAQQLPNSRVIDTSRPFEDVASEVQQIILDHVAARTAKRLAGRKRWTHRIGSHSVEGTSLVKPPRTATTSSMRLVSEGDQSAVESDG